MDGFRDLLWDRGSLVGIEHLYRSKQFFLQVFILQLRETNKQTNKPTTDIFILEKESWGQESRLNKVQRLEAWCDLCWWSAPRLGRRQGRDG